MQKTLQDVVDILILAKNQIADITNGTDYGHISLNIDSSLTGLINRVSFLAGVPITVRQSQEFKPITEFMGEDILTPQPIKPADLEPTDTEETLYKTKVHTLYDALPTIPIKEILDSYVTTEDQLVLRGVARLAGVTDYKEAPINEAFINETLNRMQEKILKTEQNQTFNKSLEQEQINQLNTAINQTPGEPVVDQIQPVNVTEPANDNSKENLPNKTSQGTTTIKTNKSSTTNK